MLGWFIIGIIVLFSIHKATLYFVRKNIINDAQWRCDQASVISSMRVNLVQPKNKKSSIHRKKKK